MKQLSELSPAVKKVQIALTFIGLSGVVLSFVAFTGDIIPLTDVLLDWGFSDELWLLVAPCVVVPSHYKYGLCTLANYRSPVTMDGKHGLCFCRIICVH